QWQVDLLSNPHNIFGLFSLPRLDTDLAIAGLGLGLVIGPLTSASLRVVPSAQHGIASAAVVVARMTGMLIGVAALSAWGFYRLPQLVAKLSAEVPAHASLATRIAAQATMYRQAFADMYGEIFKITVIVCVVGALLGLLLSSRHVHAEEPVSDEREAESARA
ncbi:MAG: MFS transporter, partial [Mycobacteriaceae bacterium]|nr:MFS transporter [Mycobacteriaceae bacterium]